MPFALANYYQFQHQVIIDVRMKAGPNTQCWHETREMLVKAIDNLKILQEENNRLKKPGCQNVATDDKSTAQGQKSNKAQKYNKDQKKILKLYSYKTWSQFMAWIEEKLEESGQTLSNDSDQKQQEKINRVLSQILEQPDFEESYTAEPRLEDKTIELAGFGLDRNSSAIQQEREMELMAIENGKLRGENIRLKAMLREMGVHGWESAAKK